jgi:mannose-6-phosphate isomerase-like protein (cupin superfamily)
MSQFVMREWNLQAYPGDMAPTHVHHKGDEAFYVIEGELTVLDGETRHHLRVGEMHTVVAGSRHTFATVGSSGARVLVVMSPEIDRLIQRLHEGPIDDMAALWAEHDSSMVG